MAQLNTKLQIYAASDVNTSTWTTITCQAREARRVTVYNREAGNALLIATDTDAATYSIAGGGSMSFELGDGINGASAFYTGDAMFALKAVTGISTQPTIVYQA